MHVFHVFPLQIRDDANEPMMVLEIDHVKGLIPSADGMKFILSVKDVFSGYVMFIPVPTDSAQDTFERYGLIGFLVLVFQRISSLIKDPVLLHS